MEKIIRVSELQKSFGKIEAVKKISFEVRPRELFAFLGPNGAGKSTTIDMLCTYLCPNGGSIEIAGYEVGRDNAKIREMIGVIHQKSLLDDLLTVRDNLSLRAGISGLHGSEIKKAVQRVAEITEIENFLGQRYGQLSGGQRRRVDIARGLLLEPQILFLDEPTTGLDPQSRNNIWQFISQLQKEMGITVFLTTHYLEEAAQADYVVIIDHGQVAAEGTPEELREAHSAHRLIIESPKREELIRYFKEKNLSYEQKNDSYILRLESTRSALPILEDLKEELRSFEMIKGTLDDAFLEITGKEIRS